MWIAYQGGYKVLNSEQLKNIKTTYNEDIRRFYLIAELKDERSTAYLGKYDTEEEAKAALEDLIEQLDEIEGVARLK